MNSEYFTKELTPMLPPLADQLLSSDIGFGAASEDMFQPNQVVLG